MFSTLCASLSRRLCLSALSCNVCASVWCAVCAAVYPGRSADTFPLNFEQDWLISQVGAGAACLWQAAPWNGTCVGHSFSQLVHRNDFDILNTSYTMAPPNSTHIPECTVRVATFAFEKLGPRHIRVCRYQKFHLQFLKFAVSQTGRSVVMVGTALPTHNSHLFPDNATKVDQLFDMHRLRQSGGIFEFCGEPITLGQVWVCVVCVDLFICVRVSVCVRCDIYVNICIYMYV